MRRFDGATGKQIEERLTAFFQSKPFLGAYARTGGARIGTRAPFAESSGPEKKEVSYDKGTPVARPVRKAKGLSETA